MIKHLLKYGTQRFYAVAYRADDWCVWPVLVVQPRVGEQQHTVTMVSLQWLHWGVGLAACYRKQEK